MSTAGIVDLMLDQGADFGIQIYWTDAERSPFTVLSPMRMDIKSETGVVVFSLVTNDDGDEDVLQTIIYNSESGLIQLNIPAAETARFSPGMYYYDLWVTYQDNTVTNATRLRKLVAGKILVNGRVTTVV